MITTIITTILTKIKGYLKPAAVIYAAAVTIAAVVGFAMLNGRAKEVRRLEGNQTALMSSLETYQTKEGEYAASVQALTLKCGEYETLCSGQAEKIKSLGIKIKRLESVAKSVTETTAAAVAPVRDTVYLNVETGKADSALVFSWADAWVKILGSISAGQAQVEVTSVDTLTQVVHRVPRRFMCIPYGTKAIRQEIISSNPHTRVVYTEYIELERKRRRK